MAEADPGIFAAAARVPEVSVASRDALDAVLHSATEPFIVRGLVSDWPLVQAGLQSASAARDYLLGHHRDAPFTVSVGPSSSGGRLFYDANMAMNFQMLRAKLPEIFAKMAAGEQADQAPAIYLGSIDIPEFFPTLSADNPMPMGERDCLASIWIGTQTRIAAHNDVPRNLACVAAGHRRFTLFPREQFRNLYLGPIDNTPAGRAVSMVDFHAPDFARFPRFRDALATAQVAEMAPGDALYIPPLWWHHVEGLDRFNILVNYWWRDAPRWLGQPQDALNHAILAIRDLPQDERAYWRDLFDYYVFGADEGVTAHIPAEGQSVLAPLTAESAARIRGFLLRQLSR